MLKGKLGTCAHMHYIILYICACNIPTFHHSNANMLAFTATTVATRLVGFGYDDDHRRD